MGKDTDGERAHLDDESSSGNGVLPSESSCDGAETTGTRQPETNGDDDDGQDRIVFNRRSYLAAAGAAAASIAGCVSDSPDYSAEIQAVSGFGYGGQTILQQPSSIELSVSESEPNDTEQEANLIEFGSTVSGSLTRADTDWYAFEVTSGEQVNITLDRSATEGISAVVLYDTTGDFANLRYVGTGEPVSFSEPAETSGTHFLQIVDTQSSDGDYTLTVAPDGNDQTETQTSTPTPTPTPTPDDGQSPYNGEVALIPGRIQAEDFDEGGEGVSYHDTSSDNKGVYRTDEAVDIHEPTDSSGGYNVGWIRDSEWLEYTTSVSSGTYDVHFRVASGASDRPMQITAALDGAELGVVDVPDTGGWQNWETVTLSNVTIDTDQTAVLRLDFISGDFNLNWVEFEQTSPTETATSTSTPTSTTEDDYGERSYGDDGYGGVS